MPMRLSSLSILIPAYNVEHTINKVVTDAHAVGKQVTDNLEIIVTDDASGDATGKQLLHLKQTVPHLRIITHKINRGYGKTIKELYQLGRREWLFSLPGDDQFDAKELMALLPETKHADMILGWREKRQDSLRRLIQSKTYNAILNILFHLNVHDVNTIRLMKRSVVHSIPLNSDTAFVDAELAIRLQKKKLKIIEIPIHHKMRKDTGATGGKFIITIYPTIIDIIRMKFSGNT
ncbi:MAG TPA: glycosyltransferase family 2 protein [Patescibacteria group bacterium]|nr:glycosyltransferase family 2 protein [Patescibacteria group bacterium]